MKIALVVLSLALGGQERLVVRLAHAFRARGLEPHVVTFTPEGALRKELGPIPVHEIPRREGFDPRLYTKLWRLFRSLRPDVVHTHNAAPLIYAVPAARLARIPSVVHTKHGDYAYPRKALQLARAATRFVHHFIAVSADTARAAGRAERPRGRLAIIENGIPLASFQPDPAARAAVRAELGIPEDARVVGTVARLVPAKDHPLLVRAMAPLLGDKTRLVIVGEGDSRASIDAAIQELDPSKRGFVVLTGARKDVPKVLCAFDLYASSSATEGLPLALPEAMTAGVPVVATAVGGVPGIVPETAGVLVPYGDPSALGGAIARLLDDAPRRARLAASARAYALGRFAEDRMVDEYLARYREPSRVAAR